LGWIYGVLGPFVNEIAGGEAFEDWFRKSISFKSKVVQIDSGLAGIPVEGREKGGHEIEYIPYWT
jgi:hypothetical protein